MRSRTRLAAGAAAALAAVVVVTTIMVARADDPAATGTGTGTGTGSGTGAEIEAGQVAVSLKQYRRDEARRVIQASVTNRGAVPIAVDRLQLDAQAFTPVPASAQDAVIAPGDRIDLPLQLGKGNCQGDRPSSAGSASVLAWARPASGSTPTELRLPLAQPVEVLDRILSLECRQRALAEAVTVDFDERWTRGEARGRPALFGSIVVSRAGTGAARPVTLVDMNGTVIFGMRASVPGRTPPIRLAASEPSLAVPVDIVVERCDGHALAESKKSYFFPVWISVGDTPEVYLALQPDNAARRQFEALIRDACKLDG